MDGRAMYVCIRLHYYTDIVQTLQCLYSNVSWLMMF